MSFSEFNRVKLSEALNFFNGKRFVPFVVILWSTVAAIVLSVVWPFAQGALNSFGMWLANSKDTAPVLAPFIYGCLERLLLPFGLHHMLTIPVNYTELGGVYVNPASHGEGRFVAPEECIKELFANGQVATQYVNEKGVPTMDGKDNLNGSSMAIEGIFSEDGKIFGKMGHSERYEKGLFQNIAGNKDQDIFANGVAITR